MDLFLASNSDDQKEEERLPQESKLTTRQWGTYRLIKYNSLWASLVAQLVKNLPAMWGTWA